jgi:hypothetical protein
MSQAGILQSATNVESEPPVTFDGQLNIGYDSCCSGDRYFKGTMDDVRIYNRALSGTEIQQIYRLGR